MYNCGAPYKFIVDVNSVPFEDSPPVVLKALHLIRQRARLISPEAQFNEVLNVGYFEKQKMDVSDNRPLFTKEMLPFELILIFYSTMTTVKKALVTQ